MNDLNNQRCSGPGAYSMIHMTFIIGLIGLLHICILFERSLAMIRNITVDDTKGDELSGRLPTYLPTGDWTGGGCKGCSAQPNASLAFEGTWHDTTHSPDHVDQRSVQIIFGGTAVYAFFITANNFSYTTIMNLTFAIDGNQVGAFVHEPGPNPDFNYNVLGYSNTSLENSFHEFVISTTGDSSLMLFDYLMYTFDSTESPTNTFTSSLPIPTLAIPTGILQPNTSASTEKLSSSKQKRIGAIVGGIMGGVSLLIGLSVLFLCLRWRRMRHARRDDSRESIPTPSSTGHASGDVDISALPVYSEKRARLRMEEIHKRIEALRLRIAHLDVTGDIDGAFTSLNPSDSTSTARSAGVLIDPQLREQLIELRAQISALQVQQQWELEQITQ